MELTSDHYRAAYKAARIVRAVPGSRTHKRLLAEASPFVMRLVEVLPLYSDRWCVATAERLAIEHVLTDGMQK